MRFSDDNGFFYQLCCCCDDTQLARAQKEIVSTNFGPILHSLTVFRYTMVKIQIARSQNM
jgi:hypothetical protein